ncbi:MAG: hypothetical protein R3B09_32300 [Nannocystaceae bacterium]
MRGAWQGAQRVVSSVLATGSLGPVAVVSWAKAVVDWARNATNEAAATNLGRQLAAQQQLAQIWPGEASATLVLVHGAWDDKPEGWGVHGDAFTPAGIVFRAERLKSGGTSWLPPVIRPSLEYAHRFGVRVPFAPALDRTITLPYPMAVRASATKMQAQVAEVVIDDVAAKGPFTLQDGGADVLRTAGLTGAHPWSSYVFAWLAAPHVMLLDEPDGWPAGVARGLGLQLPTIEHCALRLDVVAGQFRRWRQKLFAKPYNWPITASPAKTGLGWFRGRVVGPALDTSAFHLNGSCDFTLATRAVQAQEEGFRRFFASRRVLLQQANAVAAPVRAAMMASPDPDLRRAARGEPVMTMPADWPQPVSAVVPIKAGKGQTGTRPADKPKPKPKDPTSPPTDRRDSYAVGGEILDAEFRGSR